MSSEERIVRRRSPTTLVALFIVSAAITAVLGAFGSIVFPFLAPISSFYPGVAFQVSFGVWFGIVGALAGGFLGPFIGIVLTGTSAPIAAAVAVGDFFQAFIPMLAFRLGKFDPRLKSSKDWAGHIVFNVIIAQAVGATIGSGSLAAFGVFPWDIWPIAWLGWFGSNVVVVGVITTILFKVFSDYLMRTALYIERFI
ncbi:conserved hypothetical protein [Candidatus Caldarchaeum subterraneum]|uniref:Hypothetical conserved protein n=1 Tax=Caldiarchaeum subterraneum TaxID=311458 RepID=E6N2T2_CALS0|nr:hypothetical conserved protein [Candidatus Caldarchaeum subterraneum]BAJ49269.1 conserved hypothetical protein [Candidatus Caldarchaeum subterraneum]BAJ50241.1 conserved hypothetical protein [Candidatus Caldarchaeum subterraneum]GBC72543.1 hypothetical protein HRbin03_00374 [archaeon HR03]